MIVGRLAEVAHEMIWLYYSIILKQMKVVHVMNELQPSGAEVMLKVGGSSMEWGEGRNCVFCRCGEVEGEPMQMCCGPQGTGFTLVPADAA